MSIQPYPRALSPVLFLLASSHAFALCSPFAAHIRVGADPVNCQANDLQSAIDMAGECRTIIDITREHTYTSQHLAIADKPNLSLQGWGDGVTCADIPNDFDFPPYAPPDSNVPLVTIDGSSDGFGTVLIVTGNSNVGLHNLTVTGGLACDTCSGGGISFDGQGTLYLTKTTVNLNHAGYGAGISMNGSSGPATLILEVYSQILANTASVSGGGIRVEGNTRLYALKADTLIGFNHAPNGYGGGIEVIGPARADIGSPGYNGGAVLQFNDAQDGGAIAAFGQDSNDATVRLFTTDAANPVQVSNNRAAGRGGAIYMKGFSGLESSVATACAYDFRINDNVAADGAAVYADRDIDFTGSEWGSNMWLNPDDPCGPESPSALGAVACAAGVACNEMARNIAEDDNNQPTSGPVIVIAANSFLYADRLDLRHSVAGNIITGASGNVDNSVYLRNCLIADNHTQHELVSVHGQRDSSLFIDGCTLANNTIDNGYVLYGEHQVTLTNSIIDQPGVQTLDFIQSALGFLHVTYLLSNDTSTLPVTPGVLQGTPFFVNAAGGDYHLLRYSLGIDFAPASGGSDLDGLPRDVDLPDVPNMYGPRDLGAYERQLSCGSGDTIFCDGFDGQ